MAIGPAPRSSWVIVAPFALPGEKIRVRVYRSSRLHSFADLLDVISPNAELRDNSRIQCQYFGKCSGCQYQVCFSLLPTSEYSIGQMLSYESQLDIKRNIVIKAYHNFSSKLLPFTYVLSLRYKHIELPKSDVPTVHPTIGSPLQYSYRTKITPHFEAPPKRARETEGANPLTIKPDWLKIGFNEIGKRTVLDIEVRASARSTVTCLMFFRNAQLLHLS